jgi:hypothetical protein
MYPLHSKCGIFQIQPPKVEHRESPAMNVLLGPQVRLRPRRPISQLTSGNIDYSTASKPSVYLRITNVARYHKRWLLQIQRLRGEP